MFCDQQSDNKKYKNLINKCNELKDFDINYFISKLDLINEVCLQTKLYYNFSVCNKTHLNNMKVLKELQLFKEQIITVLQYINSYVILTEFNNNTINKLRDKVKQYKINSITHEQQCEGYIEQLNDSDNNITKLERRIIILHSQIEDFKVTRSEFNKLKTKYSNTNKFYNIFSKILLFLLFTTLSKIIFNI